MGRKIKVIDSQFSWDSRRGRNPFFLQSNEWMGRDVLEMVLVADSIDDKKKAEELDMVRSLSHPNILKVGHINVIHLHNCLIISSVVI